MGFDSRGVLRGSCTVCSCDGYDGGEAGMKCVRCSHPPGKHQNSNASQQEGFNSGSSSHTAYRQAQPTRMGCTSQYSGAGDAYYPVHQMQYQTVQLAQCKADGCNNLIHFEMGIPQGFGEFEYCSPQCRDRHLLPGLQVQLQQDIQALLEIASHSTASPVHVHHQRHSTTDDGSLKTAPKTNVKPVERSRSLDKSHDSHKSEPEPAASSLKTEKSSATKSSTKKNKQKTLLVILIKGKGEDSGIVVNQEIFISEDTIGFLITGVVVGSKAYKLFQDDQLRLHDIVRTVNTKTPLPGIKGSAQELFDNMVCSSATVSLDVQRSIALPPISKQLKEAQKKAGTQITHVIAMRPLNYSAVEEFGLTLQDQLTEVRVIGCEAQSPARLSCLNFGDIIRVCVVASQKEIEQQYIIATTKSPQSLNFKETLTKVLQRATKEEKMVILFIFRNDPKNTITLL